ncbi:MAG: DUF3857 domain-containing protein [Spirochaetes bacterium]|nr:DUF3857 domain-containing protein [Spirochaetota bacterium]
MMVYRNIIGIFMAVLVLATAGTSAVAGPAEDPWLSSAKRLWRGDSRGALEELVETALKEDDAAMLEYGVFMMSEALRYPELIPAGIRACERLLAANGTVARSGDLKARIGMLHGWLSLRNGDTGAAEAMLDKLGYVKDYKVIGPFYPHGAAPFDTARMQKVDINATTLYPGKLHPVRWFDARADRMGMLDIGERNLDTSDVLYFMAVEFTTRAEETRVFHIGKTGHAEIWMDGKPVFKSGTRHRFSHDQYRVKVHCVPGKHRLLLRLGDSHRDGVKFSLRHYALDKIENVKVARDTRAEANASWFPALSGFAARAGKGGTDDAFRAGYLMYAAGLDSEETGEAAVLFQAALGSDAYGRMAHYYLALCRDDEEKRDILLRKAADGDSTALLPLVKIVEGRISNGFLHEAPPLIARVREINPSCPAAAELESLYFTERGWHDEALKRSASLIESGFPSVGRAVRARVLNLRQNHLSAAAEYRILCSLDRYNRTYARALADSLERAGEADGTITALLGAVHLFPCDVDLRRKLAGAVRTFRGRGAALPYLTAALALAPDDGGILFDLGSLYHQTGNASSGLYYMKEALLRNPDNFRMKEYINAIERTPDPLDRFRARDLPEIGDGTGMYPDEAAVVILDECVMNITADGSYEKTVRRVFRINAESAIRDFSTQYILFNPATDRVENVRCTVTRGGEVVESAETYVRSLSDPESRMYYDVQARVLSVPSLARGSVVDLSYRVRSGEARLYRGYIGERIMAGGRYRTLVSNTVISRPDSMRLHVRLKGLANDRLSVTRRGDRRIYRLSLSNLPPYRDEVAMPHQSEIIPSLVVSSHGSWDDAARWYASLMRGRVTMSAEMQKDLARIVGTEDNDLDKMRKIFNHVNSSIRYVGFELGLGGLQPRNADLTYATRMGDCKDLTLVLVSMLRQSGIDARMALVRTRERGELDRSIPFIGQFNHAICYVNLEGGIFLDATAKMAGIRELPTEDRNIQALVIGDKGHAFINTSGRFYHENMDAVITDVTIDAKGGAVFRRTLTKGGAFARAARLDLLDKSEKHRGIASYWNSEYTGTSINGLSVLQGGTERPVAYSYDGHVPSFLSTTGEYAAFPSFIVSSDYYREYGMMKSRVFPVRISGGWTSDTTVRFKIPGGWEIAVLPPGEKRVHSRFLAKFEYAMKGNAEIEVRSIIVFRDSSVDPTEYGEFRDFLLFIHRKENERIIIRSMKDVGSKADR